MERIRVECASENNLKCLSLEIPKNRLVVITGLSGSGKTSLAMDVLYVEGRRRYLESLSLYARQYLGQMRKPKVKKVEGLTPAIAVKAKKPESNPRSTVGTLTYVYDLLRILLAYGGTLFCPNCGVEVGGKDRSEVKNEIWERFKGERITLLAPLVKGKKGDFAWLFSKLLKEGFSKVRIDGSVTYLDAEISINPREKHRIDLVVDRLTVSEENKSRLFADVEECLERGDGEVLVECGGEELRFSERMVCPRCGRSFPKLTPAHFSFNSPEGACPRCSGLGRVLDINETKSFDESLSVVEGGITIFSRRLLGREEFRELVRKLGRVNSFLPIGSLPPEVYRELKKNLVEMVMRKMYRSPGMREKLKEFLLERECEECGGLRLGEIGRAVKFYGWSVEDFLEREVRELLQFFSSLRLGEFEERVLGEVLEDLRRRLRILVEMGVGYLTLNRRVDSLSGGELQRTVLASYVGEPLSGVLYVLDEPTVGLHPSDTRRLIGVLKKLRDAGNTVVVIEHDEEVIESSDWVIELGPGAGENGGQVVFAGVPREYFRSETAVARAFREPRRVRGKGFFDETVVFVGCKARNLKNLTFRLPLGSFVCITGVSGSGKSTLLEEVIYRSIKELQRSGTLPPWVETVKGWEAIKHVYFVDQSPIGRTPRSTPATYTKIFDFIREIFASTKEAKLRGFDKSRFSFNLPGGRCERCKGEGFLTVDMFFLPPVTVECPVCGGKRYNAETLEVRFKGVSIADVLEMTVQEAYRFFEPFPQLRKRLEIMVDVGLGYLRLGQPSTTLSGGEAQRLKLCVHLWREGSGNLYLLDEPTVGLSVVDVRKLAAILRRLSDAGNTVVVVEHNPELILWSDYVVDLGEGGGDEGGKIVAEGRVEEIMRSPLSLTGKELRKYLKK